MLFTGLGRSVWEKTVPLVLSTALGLRPRAQFFPIRTSRPVNNIYLFHTYWDFRIKFCYVKKRFGFYFDQSEKRNESLTRENFVSSNHKPRFKRIVFSRAFSRLSRVALSGSFDKILYFRCTRVVQELGDIFEDGWTIKKICISRQTDRQVHRRPKTQEHSFKDTQRCKFADWVSQLQKWKHKNEEILPKELNEYISEFIVAAKRKDGEDSSLPV